MGAVSAFFSRSVILASSAAMSGVSVVSVMVMSFADVMRAPGCIGTATTLISRRSTA